MKNKRVSQNTNKRKELTIPVVIAIIGVIGTICATSISAYFGYLSTRTQIEQPISYTQTAEASILPLQTPTAISSTQISTQSLVPNSVAISDWENTIDYSLLNSFCITYLATVIPESENWGVNTQLTSELLDKALNKNNTNKLENAPFSVQATGKSGIAPLSLIEPSNSFSIDFSVQSIVTSQDWIKLENKVNFVIKPLPNNIPEYLHAFYFSGGCGGREDKSFSSSVIKLQTGVNEYQITVNSTKYDFFTLQPSEYDEYNFYFSCTTPGVYQILLEQQYEYNGVTGKIIKDDIPLLYCPKSLQVWTINVGSASYADGIYHVDESGIWGSTTYYWNGSGYSKP